MVTILRPREAMSCCMLTGLGNNLLSHVRYLQHDHQVQMMMALAANAAAVTYAVTYAAVYSNRQKECCEAGALCPLLFTIQNPKCHCVDTASANQPNSCHTTCDTGENPRHACLTAVGAPNCWAVRQTCCSTRSAAHLLPSVCSMSSHSTS